MTQGAKIDDVKLHSEQVDEVLGTPPHWLVRCGITVVFLALVLVLALSWIVRYPDVIPASVVITTPTPPSAVVAQTTGALVRIDIADNQLVAAGDRLAVIESSAEPAAMFVLERELRRLAGLGGKSGELPALDLRDDAALGELQADYAVFLSRYRALRHYQALDPAGQEIRSLKPRATRYRERLEGYARQHKLLQREVALNAHDYSRVESLRARGLVSVKELENAERALLAARGAVERNRLDTTDTRIALGELEQSLLQLRLQDRQRRKDLALELRQAYDTLRSRLAQWDREHVLRAPITGRVSLFNFWSEHQFVQAGDEVLTVVPDGSERLVGKVLMPVRNSGKVEPGQPVYIRLDNYPYREYGMLNGEVGTMSLVPRSDQYAIEVDLPRELVTSFGKRLDFRQEMQGRAEIVTEDLRLLERIFYQIRTLLRGP